MKLTESELAKLLNPVVVERANPWEVDVVSALKELLASLPLGVDFIVSGTAIRNGAKIHRRKVETIAHVWEERKVAPPRPPRLASAELRLPIRRAVGALSLQDLLEALDRLLGVAGKAEAISAPVEEYAREEVEWYRSLITKLTAVLTATLASRGKIVFTELCALLPSLKPAEIFLGLLFLCMEEVIELEQVEVDGRPELVVLAQAS